ncbi:hypothetical protein TH53_14840 [Pedobacter lusitanus]|uniref:Lipoprotein n=1 Tax=Pedobacter lusitanus TaxID=1503925 RepID=A0A0D0GK17_9SPHI|nr:hypothetical protein [Pedobacter lusitanus]KIO76505.1 hypothetical protein TH53_14840 [Pedobacter lusitanus]
MKKLLFTVLAAVILLSGCGTVQSIIKSSFPYTATLVIPKSSRADSISSVTSTAGSFDEVIGNQSGNDYVRDIRIASARIVASDPNDKSMGMFKSLKIFVSNGNSGEVMVASRNDIAEHIGSSLVLDIDNSRFVDQYMKGNNLKVRLEYVLRENLTTDVSVRTSLSFSSSPNSKK